MFIFFIVQYITKGAGSQDRIAEISTAQAPADSYNAPIKFKLTSKMAMVG
jgi:hypothetical protein